MRTPPCVFETSKNFLMQFPLNDRSSKVDCYDVQLMTVSEPQIKMVAIFRKEVWTQVSASIQGTNKNPKTNPAFFRSRSTTGLVWTLHCAMSAWVTGQNGRLKPQVRNKLRNVSASIQNYCEKLNSSLKRGVYRPDSTYKTAKMIHQEYSHWTEVDIVVV